MTAEGMTVPGRDTLDHLDPEQLARVAALYEARNITTMHVPRPSVKRAESFDLVELARFITGDLDPATLPSAVLVACHHPHHEGEAPDHG